jgi:hypothetical protein
MRRILAPIVALALGLSLMGPSSAEVYGDAGGGQLALAIQGLAYAFAGAGFYRDATATGRLYGRRLAKKGREFVFRAQGAGAYAEAFPGGTCRSDGACAFERTFEAT